MALQYDGVRPVVEGTLEGDTWTTTARNVWEGDGYYSPLVLRLLPSGGYNYLTDGLGSTRQLMRNSDHTVTDTYAYDAFGNTLAATGTTDNPYRYVGGLGYRAGGGGLMQTGARHWQPVVGRFTSRDILRTVHPYTYCANKPTDGVDPAGLLSKGDCDNLVDGLNDACSDLWDAADKCWDWLEDSLAEAGKEACDAMFAPGPSREDCYAISGMLAAMAVAPFRGGTLALALGCRIGLAVGRQACYILVDITDLL